MSGFLFILTYGRSSPGFVVDFGVNEFLVRYLGFKFKPSKFASVRNSGGRYHFLSYHFLSLRVITVWSSILFFIYHPLIIILRRLSSNYTFVLDKIIVLRILSA